LLVLLAVGVGIALRLALATAGHNMDMETWEIVGNVVDQGKTVYAETARYNYGPLWAYVLGGIKKIQYACGSTSLQSYHLMIAALLTWVDLLIAWSLARWFGAGLGLLFFLSPVGILLTGYHSQFEALAVLFGLWSWVVLRVLPHGAVPSWRLVLASASLLGLSLATKHLLVFFPLWIVCYAGAGSWPKRVVYCAVAYGIFLLVFVPYLGDPRARAGIVANVLRYGSFPEHALFPRVLELFVPVAELDRGLAWIPVFSGARAFWPLATVAVGWYLARRSPHDLFFVYLVVLVVFAPALSIQQLAIPVAACAYFWNRWEMRVYTLATTCMVMGSHHNLAGSPSLGPYVRWAAAMHLYFYHVIAWLAVFLLAYLWSRSVGARSGALSAAAR
jgi:hypothetical protein